MSMERFISVSWQQQPQINGHKAGTGQPDTGDARDRDVEAAGIVALFLFFVISDVIKLYLQL